MTAFCGEKKCDTTNTGMARMVVMLENNIASDVIGGYMGEFGFFIGMIVTSHHPR